MKDKRATVYVVHGYTASSEAEWFPWLKNKFAEIDVSVTIFDMPNPNAPMPQEWDTYLDKSIYKCCENTFLVGHSLGCIALLRYLEKQSDDKKIGGIILVSGFLEPVPTLPMLDPFIKKDLNIPKLIKMVSKRLVISSPNDSIVAYQYSCELAKQMDAKLISVENGGHFIAQQGFTEFPIVFDELFKMINECTELKGMDIQQQQNNRILSQFTAQSAVFNDGSYTLSNKEYLEWAVHQMPLKKSDKVIDIAAGTGLLSLAVSPYVESVLAVDLTPAMLEQGKKSAISAAIHNVVFKEEDVTKLPYTGTYDVAMCRLAFHHFLDTSEVFVQMLKALKPGGRLVVLDLISPSDKEIAKRYNHFERLRDDSHTRALTEDEFKELFQKYGLASIVTQKRDVTVNLDSWMQMTATPMLNRNIIHAAVLDEMSGGEKTGLRPLKLDNEILFLHCWMIITGVKE